MRERRRSHSPTTVFSSCAPRSPRAARSCRVGTRPGRPPPRSGSGGGVHRPRRPCRGRLGGGGHARERHGSFATPRERAAALHALTRLNPPVRLHPDHVSAWVRCSRSGRAPTVSPVVGTGRPGSRRRPGRGRADRRRRTAAGTARGSASPGPAARERDPARGRSSPGEPARGRRHRPHRIGRPQVSRTGSSSKSTSLAGAMSSGSSSSRVRAALRRRSCACIASV